VVTNPHFAWLPPEINSALMFAGPGSGPLLAAAAAWNELASELASSADSFRSVTSDLATGSWLGPTSAAMMAVASQYSTFLAGAAAQAEEAASQAGAAAAAFESALAATVQPAVVAANRALMRVLANTNFLGQNAPAIADIEGAYEQMWALDVSAMAGYHFDASAAAGRLAPWRQILQAIGSTRVHSSNGGGNGGGSSSHSSAPPPKHHHHVGLFSSVAASNLTNEIAGALYGQNGSSQNNSNGGPGGAGGQSAGAGSSGNNFGFGILGRGDGGFGSTLGGETGSASTGGHQVSFGGFNSGGGILGAGNPGTGTIGMPNSAAAVSGAVNATPWAPGVPGTGLAVPPAPAASLLSPGNFTGGINAANLSTSVLSPSIANAAFNPGFAGPDLITAAPASQAFAAAPAAGVSTANYDLGTPNPAVSASSGQNATTPLLRTAAPTGLFGSSSSESGARGTAATGDPGGGDSSGIPLSEFYRPPVDPDLALSGPGPSD
jgi:PPE-repeat protein